MQLRQLVREVTVEKFLGAGSSGGKVYKAKWRGSVVALKLMVSSNPDQLRLTTREALLSRSLSHPHLVQTYAVHVSKLTDHDLEPSALFGARGITAGGHTCGGSGSVADDDNGIDDLLATVLLTTCGTDGGRGDTQGHQHLAHNASHSGMQSAVRAQLLAASSGVGAGFASSSQQAHPMENVSLVADAAQQGGSAQPHLGRSCGASVEGMTSRSLPLLMPLPPVGAATTTTAAGRPAECEAAMAVVVAAAASTLPCCDSASGTTASAMTKRFLQNCNTLYGMITGSSAASRQVLRDAVASSADNDATAATATAAMGKAAASAQPAQGAAESMLSAAPQLRPVSSGAAGSRSRPRSVTWAVEAGSSGGGQTHLGILALTSEVAAKAAETSKAGTPNSRDAVDDAVDVAADAAAGGGYSPGSCTERFAAEITAATSTCTTTAATMTTMLSATTATTTAPTFSNTHAMTSILPHHRQSFLDLSTLPSQEAKRVQSPAARDTPQPHQCTQQPQPQQPQARTVSTNHIRRAASGLTGLDTTSQACFRWGSDPYGSSSRLLYELQMMGAAPGRYVTAVLMEYCERGNLQELIQERAGPAGPLRRRGRAWQAQPPPPARQPGQPEGGGGGAQEAGSAGRHRSGSLSGTEMLRNALEIAQAMAYLHSLDLVHGDLKPANVLLRAHPGHGEEPELHRDSAALQHQGDQRGGGQRGRASRGYCCKVADFGLTNPVTTADTLPPTTDASGWGDIAYLAPEVVANGRHGKPADVYSFGVLLWQLLTGQPPHAQLHPAQILGGLASGELALDWPQHSERTLRKIGAACTAADPQARPTFEQVVRALLKAVQRTVVKRRAAAAAAAAAAAGHAAPPAGGTGETGRNPSCGRVAAGGLASVSAAPRADNSASGCGGGGGGGKGEALNGDGAGAATRSSLAWRPVHRLEGHTVANSGSNEADTSDSSCWPLVTSSGGAPLVAGGSGEPQLDTGSGIQDRARGRVLAVSGGLHDRVGEPPRSYTGLGAVQEGVAT